MPHIVTTETRERVNRPTKLGMHPAVAERLRSLGIDPEEHAHKIRVAHGRERAKPLSASARVRVAAQAQGVMLNAGVPNGAIEASLDPDDVRVTPLLNQTALMYENNDYVADIVAPVQLVTEKSAKYKIWDRGPFRSLLDSRIGPNGSAKEVAPTLSEDNYSTVRRALKSFANNDTELANPTMEARAASVEEVVELHLVGREFDVATMFHTSGSYPGANVKTLTTGGGGTNWKQGSGANPISDVLTLLEAIPGEVTHTVMSDIVWHAAQQNAALKAILASQLDNKGLLRPMDFGLYFGIPNVIITKADYRDDTGARKRLWSETNLWMGSVNPGRDRRTFCRTFRLRQGAGGWVTKTWRDEDRGTNGGDWVRTAYEEDRKIVSSDYGAIIVNVVG
jgi:hypothetical protein